MESLYHSSIFHPVIGSAGNTNGKQVRSYQWPRAELDAGQDKVSSM